MTYDEFTTDPFGTKKKQAMNAKKKKGKHGDQQNEDDSGFEENFEEGQGKTYYL